MVRSTVHYWVRCWHEGSLQNITLDKKNKKPVITFLAFFVLFNQ